MAETAISILQEELKDVQKWYPHLLSGSVKEFQLLKDDLTIMTTFLTVAGNSSEMNKMLKEINTLVYDVQDTIDAYLTEVAKGNTIRRRFKRISFSKSKSGLGRKIRRVREDIVKAVLAKVMTVSPALVDAGTSIGQPPSRLPHVHSNRRDRVVGYDYEAAELIGYLMEEKEELDVISIVGVPGLGKTTLARKIFEHKSVCYEFSTRIWVYVSQRMNSKYVFLNILRKFTSADVSDLSDEELGQLVRYYLEDMQFLLVLDDVWSPQDWNVIKNALPISNGLSKVIITSRNQIVGLCAKVSTDPYMLRFLSLDESWKLLQLEVFGNEHDCPQELVTIGKKIAKQCYGVPLIVVVVGGLLLSMKRSVLGLLRNDWESVHRSLIEFMPNDIERFMLDVVELNYNQLPSYLRECFLYMGVFPEDHTIPAWMLTRLWIAEGFARPKDGSSLEEVAEEILGDLVSRNLLMLDQTNLMGEIKICRVHDMIRGFCRERAVEQNLFQEIRENKVGVVEPPVSQVQKFHRICIRSSLNKFFPAIPNGPQVRSFLCLHKEPVYVDDRYNSTFPEAFASLRVLESISIRFRQFPSWVTKLIHLRYLTLQIEALPGLPSGLSQLWNLQTLVIETKSRTITVKANIWKMYQLRHLKTKAVIVLDPRCDGKGGDKLQTLSRLDPESCTTKLSERARNLKELGICGKLATYFSTMSMENLFHLEKLKLMNDPLADFEPLCFPQHRWFPPTLKRLTLSSTFLEWKHMPKLAEIDTLKVLKLKNDAFVGMYWDAKDVSFDNLHLLVIHNTDLFNWEASTKSFPTLACLVLKNCGNLIEIPGDLAESLQVLEIQCLRKSAVDSAIRIEEGKRTKGKCPFKLSIRHR
ncbi:hypothetical protein OROMI_015506 [Orobanche minor]